MEIQQAFGRVNTVPLTNHNVLNDIQSGLDQSAKAAAERLAARTQVGQAVQTKQSGPPGEP
jgi:hypothetical protein